MKYFPEKQFREKLQNGSFRYDEKVLFFITYIHTHQKSSCLPEIFVGANNICSNKQ